MSELVWIKHTGKRCPVPADCEIIIRGNGYEWRMFDKASSVADWTRVTAFVVYPDQPPQLDGPLEMGARYVCRDGSVTDIDLIEDGLAYFNGRPRIAPNCYPNGMQYRDGSQHPKDLIARYYPEQEAAKPVVVVNTQLKAEFDERQAKAEWLARAEAKCARNTLANPPSCQCPACKADGIHASDCAVHNMPAYPNGPCDCGLKPTEQQREYRALTVVAATANDRWTAGVRLGSGE